MKIFDYFVELHKPESNPAYLEALGKQNIIFLACSKSENHKNHRSTTSFKYTFQGKEFYHFNQRLLATDPGHYLLVNEGLEYESIIRSDDNVESFTIFFSPDFLRKALACHIQPEDKLLDNFNNPVNTENLYFFEKLYPVSQAMCLLLYKIRFEIKGKNTSLLALQEDMHQLAFLLLEAHRQSIQESKNISAVKLSTRIELYKRVNHAKDYLLSCFKENIDLASLAQTAQMAEFHFLRVFKDVFGITPHQFLTEVRLEQAQNLLKSKYLPISEIAFQSGFDNLSSFTRLFTKRIGVSPSRYKELQGLKVS